MNDKQSVNKIWICIVQQEIFPTMSGNSVFQISKDDVDESSGEENDRLMFGDSVGGCMLNLQ